MPKHRDLFEQLSPEDPNYELVKEFYLEASADTYGLIADALAGRVSLPDFVLACIKPFAQGAQVLVEFVDDTPVLDRCREIDRLATLYIRKFCRSLDLRSTRLGKRNISRAKKHLSRNVNEIAARSKQLILDRGREPHIVPSDPSSILFGPNPFPQGHGAHSAFDDARRNATEAIGKLASDLLQGLPDVTEVLRRGLIFRLRCLSLCAHEATAIVGNEESAEWYETWLGDRAKFVIKDTIRAFQRKDPNSAQDSSPVFSQAELGSLRQALIFEVGKLVMHYRGVLASRVTEIMKCPSEPDPKCGTSDRAQHLKILQKAIESQGMNPPEVARRIRERLKAKKGKKPKADRTALYRVFNGTTKKPQPEIREALIAVLQLTEEEALVVRAGLGEPLKNLPPK